MTNVAQARQMVDALERGDSASATDLFTERVRAHIAKGWWSVDAYIVDVWAPGLDELAGRSRRITTADDVSSRAVRLTVEGENGRAYVSISFEGDGTVGGLGIGRDIFEGIANLVINCPDERYDEVKAFYAAVLGEDRWRIPHLVFDEGNDYHAPAWGDPDRPQQLHLEVEVADTTAVHDIVIAKGGALLDDTTDAPVYADPIGHALRLDPSRSAGESAALSRVVIDCPDPGTLASFYSTLLDMPVRTEASHDRVVIRGDDHRRPMLAFRRVDPYVAPRWPDPAHPAQMHFDLAFYDTDPVVARAEQLGAVRLPPGGSCPVYADPVGHPFCLCMHGQ